MGTKVLVIGSMNMDFTAKSKKLPKKGETILAHDFKMSPGGKGANQAVAASKLEADVDFIGRVGEDFIGKKILRNLKGKGVKTKGIRKDEESHSGIALIMVDDKGEDIISVASGANMKVSEEDIEKNKSLLKEAEVVLFQLEIPVETITYAAKEISEAKIILNPAPAKELPDDLLKNVDILTPNETEAEALSGIKVDNIEAARRSGKELLEKGPEAVVITLGAQGAVLVTDDKVSHIKSPDVKTVDSVGAGDAFCGALSTYLEKMNLKKAVKYAVNAGALATTEVGAQEALPTREELENFLA